MDWIHTDGGPNGVLGFWFPTSEPIHSTISNYLKMKILLGFHASELWIYCLWITGRILICISKLDWNIIGLYWKVHVLLWERWEWFPLHLPSLCAGSTASDFCFLVEVFVFLGKTCKSFTSILSSWNSQRAVLREPRVRKGVNNVELYTVINLSVFVLNTFVFSLRRSPRRRSFSRSRSRQVIFHAAWD